MTLTDFLNIVAVNDLRDTSNDPLTAADYPAFEIAVDFLSEVTRPISGMRKPILGTTMLSALSSAQLAKRAERFARMTGRQIDITYPVMAAAILYRGLPGADFGNGKIATFISGERVMLALDAVRTCRDIMRKPPSPVDEAVVLAKLALHGIDAPDHVIRLALAERPDRIVAVVREPGSHWMSSVPLLTRPWSVKLGLEHLLDDFGGK